MLDLHRTLLGFLERESACVVALQFLYMLAVGTFPFNSFLAGFLSCVASFVLTMCLRLQIDKNNKDFKVCTVTCTDPIDMRDEAY